MRLEVVAAMIMLAAVRIGQSVVYNGACTTSSECTDPNTYCEPSISPTCNKGTCKCLQHMVWDSTASKCMVKKYFVDKCNTTLTSCQGGTVCSGSNGQCVCNGIGNKYYTDLEKCLSHTPDYKLIGEVCTVDADCYQEITGAVECIGSTTKKCSCKAGYIQDRKSCRKPHYGETCTTSVGCVQEITITESSIVTETCSTSSICTCPTGSTAKPVIKDGVWAKICMNTYDGDLLAIGTTCSASNRCASSLCLACPEGEGSKCLATPSQ